MSVGLGTAQDFEGKDLRGKFVLSVAPSGLGGVSGRAVAAGAIGGHLFEGYLKQGANDDNSVLELLAVLLCRST